MSRKVCAVPGCPTISEQSRCPEHRRPNSNARGYGHAHRTQAQAWRARVAAGEHVTCWRCGQPITDPTDLDLGHDDLDRSITRGPEHAAACNRSTAGKYSRGV